MRLLTLPTFTIRFTDITLLSRTDLMGTFYQPDGTPITTLTPGWESLTFAFTPDPTDTLRAAWSVLVTGVPDRWEPGTLDFNFADGDRPDAEVSLDVTVLSTLLAEARLSPLDLTDDERTQLALLAVMVQAGEDPTISDAELYTLLKAGRRVDGYGVGPDSAEWTPTYDLNYSAVKGWRLKMAKVVGRTDVRQGLRAVSRSQYLSNCREMVQEYARLVNGAIPLPGPMNRPDQGRIVVP